MNNIKSLKEIEKQAYRSTFDDGIYDILVGIVFLIITLIPVFSFFGIPTIYCYLIGIIDFLIFWLGKRYITIPRLGAVSFGQKRKKRKLLLLLVCGAFVFMTFPLLLMMGDSFGIADKVGIPIIIGFVFVPILILIAYFLDYPRMYIYAALLSFGIPNALFLHEFVGLPYNAFISFGIPGLVIFGYGCVLLVQFIKKYPAPTVEVNHAG